MSVEQTHAPDMLPGDKSGPRNGVKDDPYTGLTSKWPVAFDLAGSSLPCRLEGEIADLVVLGDVPPQIRGTFYRVMCDACMPPHAQNVPLDGDGSVSAFRFHDGRVDMKMRYVETERFKLERKANKALFGLYRNPFTHHPCVRAAVDSTANTNLIHWAGHLLALKESAQPYAVDPETLETRGYDPFGQNTGKAFSAHPKIDPFTNELVVFGYEAKGLATRDIIVYALDDQGRKKDEQWIVSPWPALIHDCAITPNYLILFLWPFEASVERMKAGGHHWAWSYERPCTFLVVPRRPGQVRPASWGKDETHRVYYWQNCMPIHTAGAWEEDGKIYVESSRVHDNAFPFFPPDDGRMPAADAKADFVRWVLDPEAANDTKVPDPEMVLDVPSEFPRIDERFWSKKYDRMWLNVFIPDRSDGGCNIFHGLNGLAQYSRSTGKTEYFYAGDDSLVQEPIFVPRSEDAPEGDGWVMAMVERRTANRNDVVVLDTKNFAKPVAIVQLPFHVKAQVHGNWVSGVQGSLVRPVQATTISGRGALEVEA